MRNSVIDLVNRRMGVFLRSVHWEPVSMIASPGRGTAIGVVVLVNFNLEASRAWMVCSPLRRMLACVFLSTTSICQGNCVVMLQFENSSEES